MKKNYYLEVIQAAVVNNDFEFDEEDSIMDVFGQACNNLSENPIGKEFVYTELHGYGIHQGYTFFDEKTGYSTTWSGEIFDFNYHYKAEDGVLYREKDNGEFEPVNWFDIPMGGSPDGDAERKKYIFVFTKEILSDGRMAYLYDYFA